MASWKGALRACSTRLLCQSANGARLTLGCAWGQIHELVEKAGIVKEGWNGYNVLHDIASRVGALDIGFLPSARASAPDAPPPKVVYLLNSDDFSDADVPADAFVIYQARCRCAVLWACAA